PHAGQGPAAGDIDHVTFPGITEAAADACQPVDVASHQQGPAAWEQPGYVIVDGGPGNVGFESDDPARRELPVRADLAAADKTAAIESVMERIEDRARA